MTRMYEKHGLHNTKEYRAWHDMRQRCGNPNNPFYSHYGARGVMVCERWNRFAAFYEDMGPRPPGMTLERKDNSKGYCKDNCYWATKTQQARNMRSLKNTSGVVGVTWNAKNKKWKAQISVAHRTIYLGESESLEKARKLRLAAERTYWQST